LSAHLGVDKVGVVLTLVILQDELVNALDHFPGGSVIKTEDVLIHTLTKGTQEDAHGLTDVAVPHFEL